MIMPRTDHSEMAAAGIQFRLRWILSALAMRPRLLGLTPTLWLPSPLVQFSQPERSV